MLVSRTALRKRKEKAEKTAKANYKVKELKE